METREAQMAELLQWSSYKHLYMEYVMDIQALYDIVVQISNNQTDLQELKHKSSGDTSPDKFFNLLISPIAIEEGNTFFQAAFKHFQFDLGQTGILMEDAMIWLTKAAMVDLMVSTTYDYNDQVGSRLAIAEQEWKQRITTLQEALQNTEKMARVNVEAYVKEELDSYFKDVTRSSNNLTSQAKELGSILDAKFDWIQCRINLFNLGGLSVIKHEHGICSQMPSFHFTCFKDSCSVSSHYIIYCTTNKTNPTYNPSPSPNATSSPPEVDDKSPERTLIDSHHTNQTRLVLPADLESQLAVDSECIRLYQLEREGQEYVMYVDECTSKQLVEVSCHHFERGLVTYNQVYIAAGVAGGVLLLLIIICCCCCCCKNNYKKIETSLY